MNAYRDQWMKELLARDIRIVDPQVTASLQNGTAFFASTSLIAIGGTLTLVRAPEQVLTVIGTLPFAVPVTPEMWEMKILGLAVICVYAFFKFAWSYRLFNYLAIMIGAAPPPSEKDSAAAKAFAHRASRVCADAGLHFNRGQRAFFFALGYLGWFLGPLELGLSTTGVLIVMWRRHLASDRARPSTGRPDGRPIEGAATLASRRQWHNALNRRTAVGPILEGAEIENLPIAHVLEHLRAQRRSGRRMRNTK